MITLSHLSIYQSTHSIDLNTAALYAMSLGQDDRRMAVGCKIPVGPVAALLSSPSTAALAAGLMARCANFRRRAKEICEAGVPTQLLQMLSDASLSDNALLRVRVRAC